RGEHVAETFPEFRATGCVVHFDALAFATDQAGFAQDFEMLGESRLGQGAVVDFAEIGAIQGTFRREHFRVDLGAHWIGQGIEEAFDINVADCVVRKYGTNDLYHMNTKTILITGGTTGIGLATAQRLSAEGANVIVTGRNPETLASAKKTLNGVVVLPSDSGDLGAAQALGDEIKPFADHLDGAFLNAGIATFGPFDAATPKNYDDMFNVNVRGS